MGQKPGVLTVAATALALLSPFVCHAQDHDKNKFYQIRSMEVGKWEFNPGLYYMTFHKSYSGGEWCGFLGLNIKFTESKSNVKTVSPSRTAQIPLAVGTVSRMKEQLEYIEPLVQEEVARSAERMIDIVYNQYADDFITMSENITDALSYCRSQCGSLFAEACDELYMVHEEIFSGIDYIHAQGINNEIETTKRQLAYEDFRERLIELCASCRKLTGMVTAHSQYRH